MGNLAQDLRFALRTLTRLRGFAVTAITVVALGIGATAAMFSAVDALLLRPLPLPDPDRLVDVVEVTPDGEHTVFTYVGYRDLRQRSQAVDRAAWSLERLNLRTVAGIEPVHGAVATGNYFAVLGAAPARGRFFGETDDRQGAPEPVAVLSHGAWQRRFGADEAVLGRSIHLNGVPVTVIGVAPAGFSGATVGIGPEVWVPMTLAPRLLSNPSLLDERQIRYYDLVGRLAPGLRAGDVAAALSSHGSTEPAARQDVQGRIRLYPTTGLPRDGRDGVVRFVAKLEAPLGSGT